MSPACVPLPPFLSYIHSCRVIVVCFERHPLTFHVSTSVDLATARSLRDHMPALPRL